MTLRIIFDDSSHLWFNFLINYIGYITWYIHYFLSKWHSSLSSLSSLSSFFLGFIALSNKDNLLFLHLFILNSESVALVVLHFIAILNNLIIICPLDKDTVWVADLQKQHAIPCGQFCKLITEIIKQAN